MCPPRFHMPPQVSYWGAAGGVYADLKKDEAAKEAALGQGRG